MNTVSVGLIALYFLATSLVTLDAFSAYPNVGFAGYLSKKCSGMGGEIYSKNLCGELSILKYNGTLRLDDFARVSDAHNAVIRFDMI
jgi:hypothetical protein